MSICPPALLYLILGLLAIFGLIIRRINAPIIVFKSIIVLLWTWFLSFLCTKGYETVSWILVLLPYILMIIFVMILYGSLERFMDKMSDEKHY